LKVHVWKLNFILVNVYFRTGNMFMYWSGPLTLVDVGISRFPGILRDRLEDTKKSEERKKERDEKKKCIFFILVHCGPLDSFLSMVVVTQSMILTLLCDRLLSVDQSDVMYLFSYSFFNTIDYLFYFGFLFSGMMKLRCSKRFQQLCWKNWKWKSYGKCLGVTI